jgi:hypothetical protein
MFIDWQQAFDKKKHTISSVFLPVPTKNPGGPARADCCDTGLRSRNSYEALRRTGYCLSGAGNGRGTTMHVTQAQLKMIAIGLILVFLVISLILPKTTVNTILSAVVMIAALVISYIGWSMEKREAGEDEDLLAVPPKRS